MRVDKETKKIIEGLSNIKSWVNENLELALKVKLDLMTDVTITPSTRNTIASDIIKLHAFFYASHQNEVRNGKSKDNHAPLKLVSLKFDSEDDDNLNVGVN